MPDSTPDRFLFGCCLGYLFLKFKNRPHKSTCILLEILTIVLIIGSLYLYATHKTILGTEFIRYSLLFTPTTVSIIWLISKNGGIVSKLLQNNMLVKIGNLSPYTFLIHGLTIKLYNLVVPRLFKNIPLSVVAVISLLLTFVAAKFWIELEKNVSFRKR